MIFDAEFYYGQYLRWNLGWASPNYAGSFLAASIPLFWLVGRVLFHTKINWSLLRITSAVVWFFFIEGTAIFLLSKTYSRGALAGMITALVGFTIIVGLGDERRGHPDGSLLRSQRLLTWIVFSVRVLMIIALMLATGFGARVSMATTGTDAAVGNRVEFWKTCTEMVSCAPWSGWGTGESGRVYMNWFQALNRTEGFITPVNSYLHIAVEQGLPSLMIVFFSLSFLVVSGIAIVLKNQAITGGRLTCIAGAISIVLAWATTNLFTTLWGQLSLWVIPLGAIFYLCFEIVRNNARFRIALPVAIYSMLIALLFCLYLYIGGHRIERQRVLHVASSGNGNTYLSHKDSEFAPYEAIAWLDASVLGPNPGKELRRWMTANQNITGVEVCTDLYYPKELPSKTRFILLFGRQASRVGLMTTNAETWLIHPTGRPPDNTRKSLQKIRVILPEIDENGDCFRWKRWAKSVDAIITISNGSGQDIRSVWPKVTNL